MKTQNVLKGIRLMTFIAVLGFISLSANAVDYSIELSKEGEGSSSTKAEAVTEASRIELEEWMMDVNNFVVERDVVSTLDWVYTEEKESEIGIESWMIHSDRFGPNNSNLKEIETWMLDYQNFRVSTDNKMVDIEDWMTNPEFFKIQ
jgi:hypothetical protein